MKKRTQALLNALPHLDLNDAYDGQVGLDVNLTSFSCCAITKWKSDRIFANAAHEFYTDFVLELSYDVPLEWLPGTDKSQKEIQAERLTALCFAIAASETEE